MDFKQIMEYSEDNRDVFDDLCKHKSIENDNCIPFVGAGISGFVYPCWGKFLEECANKIHNIDKRQKMLDLIKQDYEIAADEIQKVRGKAGLYADIEKIFSIKPLNECSNISEQAVYLFPYLFKGPLLTTNYDNVLEKIYHDYGVILPVGHPSHSEMLLKHLVNHLPMLYKFHGDVTEPGSIILGKSSYDKAYQENSPLINDFKTGLNHQHLLFLGCSLGHDRTVDLIKKFALPGLTHYAILDCNEDDIDKYIGELGDIGVRAILYPKGQYSCLRTILKKLLAETDPEGYKNYISTEKPKMVSQRFKYSEEITEFIGRNEQIEELKKFVISEKSSFSWWAIVGPGGAGKSRLAFEFIKQARAGQLLASFTNYYFVGVVEELPPPARFLHNSLIVIDYVRSHCLKLGNWLVDLDNHTVEYDIIIRVLLIEREGDGFEDAPWINTIKDECFYKDIFENTCYNKFFLKLEPLQKEDIIRIMVSYANAYQKYFDPAQLYTMYEQFEKIDKMYSRPLYAMFIADAWINEAEQAYMWGKNALLGYIVDREISIYEDLLRSVTIGAKRSSSLSEAFLACKFVATIYGDTEIRLLGEALPDYWGILERTALHQQYRDVETMLISLNLAEERNNNITIITPVEPDLVGEFFVWTLLNNSKIFKTENKKEILKIIWSKPQKVYAFGTRLLNDFSDVFNEDNIKMVTCFIEPYMPIQIILKPDLTNQYASYLVELTKIHNILISKSALGILKQLIDYHTNHYRERYCEKYAEALTNYIAYAPEIEIGYCVVILSFLLEQYPQSMKIKYQYALALMRLCLYMSQKQVISIMPIIEKVLTGNLDKEYFVVLHAQLLQRFFINEKSLKIIEQYIYRFPDNILLPSLFSDILLKVLSNKVGTQSHFSLLDSFKCVQYVNPYTSETYCLALLSIAYLEVPLRNRILEWLPKCLINTDMVSDYTPNLSVLPCIAIHLEQWSLLWIGIDPTYRLWYIHALFLLVLFDCQSMKYVQMIISLLFSTSYERLSKEILLVKIKELPKLLPINTQSHNVYKLIGNTLFENIMQTDVELKKITKQIAIEFTFKYAMWCYNKKQFDVAYDYFEKSATLGDINSKINMIYMLRRGEVIDTTNKIECLFEEIDEWNDPTLCINRALYLLSHGNECSLNEADLLIASISDSDISDAVAWWNKLYQNGEIEGVIVLNWLYRHKLYSKFSPITEKYRIGIFEQYFYNKDWIIINLFSN